MWAMGFLIYFSLGWKGFVIPVLFFVLGSFFTRLGYAKKMARRAAEKNEGKRGAREVLAKGLIPTLCAVPLVVGGSSLFLLGYVGAWAAALCDTSSTELGSLWGKRTVTLRNLRRTAPGTSGAVSLEGTAAGLVAALILVSTACALKLVPPSLVIPLACAALAGSLVESLLGGTVPAAFALKHEVLNLVDTAIGGGLSMLYGACFAKP